MLKTVKNKTIESKVEPNPQITCIKVVTRGDNLDYGGLLGLIKPFVSFSN